MSATTQMYQAGILNTTPAPKTLTKANGSQFSHPTDFKTNVILKFSFKFSIKQVWS